MALQVAGPTDKFLGSLAHVLMFLEYDRSGDEVLRALTKRTLRDLFVLRSCGAFTTKSDLKLMISWYFPEEAMPNVCSQLLLAHHHIFGASDIEGKRKSRRRRK